MVWKFCFLLYPHSFPDQFVFQSLPLVLHTSNSSPTTQELTMRYSVASFVVLASALTNASTLGKRVDCQTQANECRTAPEANQSFCSAQLSACLGYNPYANNTATTTTSSYAPKESCQAAADQCRVQPGANQATVRKLTSESECSK